MYWKKERKKITEAFDASGKLHAINVKYLFSNNLPVE
jgi:hypothetical protein